MQQPPSSLLNGTMNEILWEVMEELYIKNPESFPKAITYIEDIWKIIRLFRMTRRTSDSQALRMGTSQKLISISSIDGPMICEVANLQAISMHPIHNKIYWTMCTNDTQSFNESKRSTLTTGGIRQASSLSVKLLSFIYWLMIRKINPKDFRVTVWFGELAPIQHDPI